MSSIESQVQQLENNIRESKKLVDMGESLERLMSNRDFKKVILEGFFEKEAIRLVHLKGDTNMQTADSQKSILTQMDAIASLAQYLQTVRFKANMAAKAVASDTETIDELNQESLNVG